MLCFYSWESGSDSDQISIPSLVSSSPFTYESIGYGALMLNPHQTWGWVSHLAKELLVIAHNSRPEAMGQEAQILLKFKSDAKEKQIVSGKTLYLDKNETIDGYVFSDGPQSVWIKPILLENGRVLVEAGKKIGQLDTSHGTEEKGQFVLPVSFSPSRVDQKFSSDAKRSLHDLKNAKCWGKDQLIQQYGGSEFSRWKEKMKIEFPQGANSYVCFVATGDYLSWQQGRWKEAALSEVDPSTSVAWVKAVSPRGIELTVWDESGFYPASVELAFEHSGNVNPKIESVMTQLRLRSASQISCMLGKKRVVLRQGDWMLKTGKGWRSLRRKEEIESYLQHRIKGELLIFDSLEKEQGRFVMKGTLFDEMRTQAQNISIPIEIENKNGKSQKKRKIPFSSQGGVNG